MPRSRDKKQYKKKKKRNSIVILASLLATSYFMFVVEQIQASARERPIQVMWQYWYREPASSNILLNLFIPRPINCI